MSRCGAHQGRRLEHPNEFWWIFAIYVRLDCDEMDASALAAEATSGGPVDPVSADHGTCGCSRRSEDDDERRGSIAGA
jgi:hypothetical protein